MAQQKAEGLRGKYLDQPSPASSAASALLGDLLQMQILRSQSQPTESETLWVQLSSCVSLSSVGDSDTTPDKTLGIVIYIETKITGLELDLDSTLSSTC